MKKFVRMMGSSFAIVGELFSFLWQQKLWWLMPMVFVLVSLAIVMFITGASGLGPFIYTLF